METIIIKNISDLTSHPVNAERKRKADVIKQLNSVNIISNK